MNTPQPDPKLTAQQAAKRLAQQPAPPSDGELTRGSITFVESFVPALGDGDYEVVVGQRVRCVPPQPAGAGDTPAAPALVSSGEAFDEVFVNRHHFRVEGPRFRLEAGAIRTVFPPPESLGEYQGTLPHVVLERKTLPWERSAEPHGDRVPWLALLLLDAADAAAAASLAVGQGPGLAWQPQTMAISALADLPANTVSYPGMANWEKEDGSCQILDLPVALWQVIAPTCDELRWLAHARHVQDQSPSESAPVGGDLAVVVGNRLPQPNQRATVHLVSLEGLRDLLPDQDGQVTLPAGKNTIRLLSLKSWSFTSHDPKQSFAKLLKHASVGPLCVPLRPPLGVPSGVPSGAPLLDLPVAADLPTQAVDQAAGQTAEQAMQRAFAMGYTALDHQTRQGTATVSWYRGPLLPFVVDAAADPAAFEPLVRLGEPVGSADELLRLDPASGMLDTSCAAAWQLGQLLALNDRSFSTALYDWKHSNLQAAALELEKRVLNERLGAFVDLSRAGLKHDPMHELMHDHLAAIDQASAALLAHIDAAMPMPTAATAATAVVAVVAAVATVASTTTTGAPSAAAKPVQAYHAPEASAEQFMALVRDRVAWRSIGAKSPVPVLVTRWLARLRLLRGVPFSYLVPEASMLPPESLRFFQLDGRWLQALVEGAFSIGRSSHAVGHHDAAFHHVAHPPTVVSTSAPMSAPTSAPMSTPMVTPAAAAVSRGDGPLPAPVSGFLLRSTAVSGWPALQVSAFAPAGSQPLPVLRTVHLSPSVLLVMVEGLIERVLIAEPPEGLHFGVALDGERCVKPLRCISGAQAGMQLGAAADVLVPFRGLRQARVINIAALQRQIHATGDLQHANDDTQGRPRNFTAAEFALQMIEGVQAVQFRVGG